MLDVAALKAVVRERQAGGASYATSLETCLGPDRLMTIEVRLSCETATSRSDGWMTGDR
ncbi:hypothetical protein ACGF7W_33650 [Streptomyces sp. NPDC048219]|uniref:hypothetical protein n=1 Tax=Streptomyces sp. NPDC048219 TaxID=3365517 RepID=UPI00371D1C81